jgi:hypothetical protein
MESLESRHMLATITVDSLADDFDPGNPIPDTETTLREALLALNSDSVVGDADAPTAS